MLIAKLRSDSQFGVADVICDEAGGAFSVDGGGAVTSAELLDMEIGQQLDWQVDEATRGRMLAAALADVRGKSGHGQSSPTESVAAEEPAPPLPTWARALAGVVCLAVVALCFAVLGWSAPRPERFSTTDLYFTHQVALPADMSIRAAGWFSFTIVNREGRDWTYEYAVTMTSPRGSRSVTRGSVTLKKNASATEPVTITPPAGHVDFVTTVTLTDPANMIQFAGHS